MRCDCGQKNWVGASSLWRHKQCKKCSIAAASASKKLVIPVGKIFGNRVVVEVKMSKGNQYCRMLCACGNETWVRGAILYAAQKCKSCHSINIANKFHHPNLKNTELQQILGLSIYKKQSLRELGVSL